MLASMLASMAPDALRELLDTIPDASVEPSAPESAAVQQSIDYLASPEAARSLRADAYWPKWHSPWWHMRLLQELGLGRSIPQVAARGMVDALTRMPLKIFPIHAHEMPEGVDPYRHVLCHCALGSIVTVLRSAAIDVDAELPWVRPWFARYQMADGGLSCDSDAYLQAEETPSSMVGTIACFEAMLDLDPTSAFVERAAAFLLERRLMLGSATTFNESERESAKTWGALCAPRFYFYDVLRGLSALVSWAQLRSRALPLAVVSPVVEQLARSFPDGIVRVQRNAHANKRTLVQHDEATWERGHPATDFPLLSTVGELGGVSPSLTRQWRDTRRGLRSIDLGT